MSVHVWQCAQMDDTKSDTMIYFLVLADTSDKKTGSHTKFIFTLLSLHCCSFWQAHGQAHRGKLTLPTTPAQMHSKITQNQSVQWMSLKSLQVQCILLSQWIHSKRMSLCVQSTAFLMKNNFCMVLFCLFLFCLGQKESSPGAFSSLVIR